MNIIKPRRLVFMDVETGDIDPLQYSLLSVCLAVWEQGRTLGKLHIFINDGELKVSPEAASINGFNKEEHLKKAVDLHTAYLLIMDFLSEYFLEGEKIKFVGHNISFDISFFKYFLSKNGMNGFEYFKRFSHRSIDTASLMSYLYLIGKISIEIDGSDNAFKYFGIEVDGRHTAEGDNLATIKLFEKLIEIGY